MKGEKLKMICKFCGSSFEDYVSNKRSGFCSVKCYWKSKEGSKGYWSGKKRDASTIEKLSKSKLGSIGYWRGKKRPELWKGGKERKNWWTLRRILIKKGNGGSHTFEQWIELKNKYNFTCPCCHRKEPEIKLTQDHIISVKNGGSDNIENIQPLCGRCNSSKQTKEIRYV